MGGRIMKQYHEPKYQNLMSKEEEDRIRRNIALNMDNWMIDHNMSQTYFSTLIGATPTAVNNWITCHRMPTVFTLILITQVMGCTLDDLIKEPKYVDNL